MLERRIDRGRQLLMGSVYSRDTHFTFWTTLQVINYVRGSMQACNVDGTPNICDGLDKATGRLAYSLLPVLADDNAKFGLRL